MIGRKTILVQLKWTKTMQKPKQKPIRLPLLPLVSKQICPIHWIKHMIALTPGTPTDPLFLTLDRFGKKLQPLTYRQVMQYLKMWMEEITGSSDGWSMHSLRRGGATWCFNIDIATEAIRMMGTWASDAYKRYLDLDLNKQTKTMKKITSSINKLIAELDQ